MFPTSGDSHCSSHQEVKAFKKTVVFVCCFIIPRSQREQIHKVCACPRATGPERTVWRFLEFSRSWPGVPWCELDRTTATCLGGGVGGCLVTEGSASPFLPRVPDPSQVPHKETARHRGAGGLFGLGDIHPARAPGLRLPGSDPRARCATVRPGSGGDPGQSRYSPGCAGGGVLTGLLIATRRGDAVGALQRRGSPAPGPCLSVVPGAPTPRGQKGGAPLQDRHTSTFFFFSTTWP